MSSTRGTCGKFILGGEHSVIYRGRALAFPIPQWRLWIESTQVDGLWVNGVQRSPQEWELLTRLIKVYGGQAQGLSLRSDIPIGAGLGSSAALCTELARHFTAHRAETLAQQALEGEKLLHGTSSGVDPYTVALEKPLLFQPQQQQYREPRMEKMRSSGLCFVLRDSGLRRSTVEVIETVKKTKRDTPLIWEDLMDALASNVEAMLQALENNPRALGRLMSDTHFRLLQLGVSCDPLDDLVEDMKKRGALGAKLTGAGRGGFVLGLFDGEVARSLPSDFHVLTS